MNQSFNDLKTELAADIAAFIEANIKTVLLVLLISSIVLIIIAVINIVAQWRIFEKAGERGWFSLIPILSGHVFHKIAWHPFFFWFNSACLLSIEIFNAMQIEGGVAMPYISLAALILSIGSLLLSVSFSVKLARSFGHGVGFALGLIFLPLIFVPILGLGSSIYQGKIR